MPRSGIRSSGAVKDLIVLIVTSIMLFVFAAYFGGFDALEKWERVNGLSKVYAEDIILILVILGIAGLIFFFRRYQDLHGEIQERKVSEQTLRDSRSKAILEQKELEKMFRQVESVKKEWERMLDCTGGMVILVDNYGKVNRCNQAFRTFVEKTYSEIRGQNLSSLLEEQGVEAKDLAGRTLTAFSALKGKKFELKSYTYKDFLTNDITGAVVVIHEEDAHGRFAEALRD